MANFIDSDLVLKCLVCQFVELRKGLEDQRSETIVAASNKHWLQEKQVVFLEPI
jgi:hypothetical protein